MSKLRKKLRFIRYSFLIVITLLILPVLFIGMACVSFTPVAPTNNLLVASEITSSYKNYTRPEDQTYLTYPEWYIVYSADEYADFIAQNPPSAYPYFDAAWQVWDSYRGVCHVTRSNFAFNFGYHLSNYVTSTSFTVETILRGAYELTFGRFTEWVGGTDTEEDAYAQRVAREYGTFIHTIPWYEFPYAEKLKELWSTTSLIANNPIRKWERKFALTVEYGVKSIYASLIKQGTAGVYAPEELSIMAIVEGMEKTVFVESDQVRILSPVGQNRSLISIPRYEAFTLTVPKLIKQGVRFVEIAGNDEILITALADARWKYNLSHGQFLFAMPVLTTPNTNRIAIRAPVYQLHNIVLELNAQNVRLEHVYDY
jgi:hypothetical protein